MCNDYGNNIPYSAYVEAFSHLKIRLFAPGGAPNLQPRDDIWPTDLERNLRRRQLTDDGNVEITGRDLREKTPPVGQGSLFARATAG